MEPGATGRTRRRHHVTLAAGALVLVYALFVVVSWRRSGDLLVDWGRELYTAWRLSEGDVLYRDVAWMFGPLAVYANSLLFRATGASATALQVVNTIGIAILSILLYDLFRRVSNTSGGLTAAFVYLSVFAFGHMTEAGIFNFVTPYSHEATWGVGLCVALVWSLAHLERTGALRYAAGAGLAAGLAWLTKPEIGVAALATLAVGALLLSRASERAGRRTWWAIGGGLFLPVVVCVAAFWPAAGPGLALRAPVESFRSAFATAAWDLPFYRALAGLDRPWYRLTAATAGALSLVAVLAGLELLDRRLAGRLRGVKALAAFAGVALAAVLLNDEIPWPEMARPLPVLVALLTGVAIARAWSRTERVAAGELPIAVASWCVLSLVLLWKVALMARFYHFGFVLTFPATVLVAVVLVIWIPRAMPPASGRLVAAFGILLVGLLCGNGAGIALRQFSARTFPVASGSDRMRAFPPYVDPRAVTVSWALDQLEQHRGGITSLLVLPEGVTLNYWLRIPTPTAHTSFMPPELARFGRDGVWRSLLTSPPDAVVLTERRMREYRVRDFLDTSFGEEVERWLARDYCRLGRLEAHARDFEPRELKAPRNVSTPSHYVELYGRRGSSLCG